MPESSSIMGMVGAFIGIAILLSIGIQILGNSVQDCTSLPDWNATVPNANTTQNPTITLENQQTGWAAACVSTNNQTQSAYALLIIILIVIAAIAILYVVRML